MEQTFLEAEVQGDEDNIQPIIENGGIRKNLLDEFADIAKADTSISNNGRECMKVYLRIRPFTDEEKEQANSQECMEKDGENAILLNAPKDSFTFKNEKRGREVTHRFTFSHVFGAETTQKEFFDSTSLDMVKDFMDGQNCLVFTYGVTNSGKTYTIQGTPKDGGILPRTLDVLFNSIHDKHYSRMNLKPRYFCDVVKIDEKQEHMEGALRNGLLMSLNKEHFDLNSFLQLEESNNDISKASSIGDESSLQASIRSQDGDITDNDVIPCGDEDIRTIDDTSISVETQGPVKFAIWVSFAEIYNEQIFDLLEPCPEGKGKKRTTLKLGDDKHGNPYIKGLREICVSNADEAYKILRVGKKNQRIASTKLNQNSSRSHCIFSVKVLRVVDVEDPHVARVSRLSFVDLAGSERYTKTQSTGDRLKESGNINTSLMTLGKCLENLRYNQIHPNNLQIIPFRESKLTRLFQGFFCGKGKASMIVNINQCANTFDETYHALKFSAIAKQVTTRVSKPVDMAPPVREKSFRPSFAFPTFSKDPRKSIQWENGAFATPAVDNMDDNDDNNDEIHQYIQQLENLVRQFESELIEEKKAKATLELKIREEVCAEMAQQLVAIETAYSERIQDEVSAVEEKCERRIEILAKSIKKTRKRARIERPDDDDEEQVSLAQLRSEKDKVKTLTVQVSDLTNQVNDLTTQLKQYESNIESMKIALEDSEKTCKQQEEVMADLQSALETSSKELEIAKLKIDKRDKMLKEKEEMIEQLQKKLDDQTKIIEENNNLIEQKGLKIVALENDLSQHQQALDDNESFLAQLNEEVKQLSSELTKNKNQEHDEHHKDIKLETALAKKISKLREQLLAKDELMKELVQSLEETRSQVELEKGDLAMVCNKQKKKIEQLEADLKAEKDSAHKHQENELAALKEQLKKAEDHSLNAKEEVETNCFEKEELKFALDAANAKLTTLQQEASSKSAKALELLKSLEEANTRVGELEQMLNSKKQEVDTLNDKVESLELSNKKAKELFGKLEDEVSRQEKTLVELEKLKQLKMELDDQNSKIIHELQCKEKEMEKASKEVQQLTEKLENLTKENGELRITMTVLENKEKQREKDEEERQELEKITKIDLENKEKQREKERKSLEAVNNILLDAKEKEIQELMAVNQKLIKDMGLDAQKKEQEQKEKGRMLAENILLQGEVEQLKDKQKKATKETEELKSKLDSTQKVTGVKEDIGEMTQTESSSKEFQELENQLKATTIALDKKNSQLISRNNAVKRLELSLSEKEARITELTKSQGTPSTPGRDLRMKEEVKTLRRRLVQADKDSEEYKQKLQNYENKIADLNKHAEDMSCQLAEAQDKERKYKEQVRIIDEKASQLNEKVLTAEKEQKEAQEKWTLATTMLEEKDNALQMYYVQQDESKQKEFKSNDEIERLKMELKMSREKLENKNEEISQLKVEAQNHSKKIEEIKLKNCAEVKKGQDEMKTLMEKMKNAEAELAKNEEKQKNFEDSKDEEMLKLQKLIEAKEQQLTQKSESLQSLQKKFTETDKEKSEELDKVWKTMVELQDVIKERGQTIDDLETKLSKAEARHSREKATLENTVAKIKEVMETKGGDRKKLLAQITELENKVSALNEKNSKLIQASEQSEKDLQELKKVLEQQDTVMEEQEKALNERQAEIESLLAESNQLQDKLNTKHSKTENTTAEVCRLEGTLAVLKDEKAKLENELKEIRKDEEEHQLTKVEMSRDHEKEKSEMLIKLEKKEGNISKVKAQVKSLQSDKKALEQKCKEKEAEIKKLEKRLKNAEEKQEEYENLCQVKDDDIRSANEEKDVMLKAMREALAVASSKKEEFDEKIKTLKEEHQNEITQLRKQCEVDITTKMLHVNLTKIEETPENQQPKPVPKDPQPNNENAKPKKQRRTTRTKKTTAVIGDENDAPTSNKQSSNKESSNEEVLSDITPSVTNNSIKILRDEPIPDDRIEIDVTPIQRRKRASRAATGSKTKPKKRRSSELPLSEIKSQLSAKKSKQEQSEEEFTPGSVIRTRRATRASSTSSSCSARKQRPPVTPMTPMDEASNETEQIPSSAKKKRFFGKLFSGSNLENTPPAKKSGRRLLKKDISAPMDSFSPCIATITTSNKKSNKAGSIIQRQLRSRVK